jgi:hypothetical protein
MMKRDRSVWSPGQRVQRFFVLPLAYLLLRPLLVLIEWLGWIRPVDDCFKQVFEELGSDFDWERACSPPEAR